MDKMYVTAVATRDIWVCKECGQVCCVGSFSRNAEGVANVFVHCTGCDTIVLLAEKPMITV